MVFFLLVLGIGFLPLLFRLALRLRLGGPLLYVLAMLTVFHGWYQAHTVLADGILLALLGLVLLSWGVTLIRKAAGILHGIWAECTAAAMFASRVRQARANGESAVSTEGLWG